MYIYDDFDQALVDQRVAQFRDQTRRFLSGELDEEAYKPLRLMNGLYIQRHAPMLRVAIPYGLLSARQLRMLGHIARVYDRGYGHFTTRQNIQFNWPRLEDTPTILGELASVQMHAIQTSGNCIRNVTADHLAGVAADEVEDPRPYAEIIRQWSTFHPEFSYLPRKFKIAVSGSSSDRAITRVYDIGLQLVRNAEQETGFAVYVGGGLGRMPIIGELIRAFLPTAQLLAYLKAILRVYNLHGRRDNIHRARIKVLVKSLGRDEFARQVEQEWTTLQGQADLLLEEEDLQAMRGFFTAPVYDTAAADDLSPSAVIAHTGFARWYRHNTEAHRQAGYRVVMVSLKRHGGAPGDMTAEQMEGVAALAERYSANEVRVLHTQNLALADVRERDLHAVWRQLDALGLAAANINTLTDMIACPGLDYCSLANASAIAVAEQIQQRFDDLDYLYDLGEVRLNISGCMNACAHHHIGHIGILGVDKKGEEFYQITLGGSGGQCTVLGEVLGPSVAKAQVADTVAAILDVYLECREEGESFLEAVRRLGIAPFKHRVYGVVPAGRELHA